MKAIALGYIDYKNSNAKKHDKNITKKEQVKKRMSEKVLSYEQLIMKYADKIASIAFVHKTTEERVLHDIWEKLSEDDTNE